MNQQNAIVTRADTEMVRAGNPFMPALSVDEAVARRNTIVAFTQAVMKSGTDYGAIPGTDKPTLLKPGAEKLNTLFGLTARPTIVEKSEDWTGAEHGGEPFFYYMYRYALSRDGVLIAEADGSCNSWEKKYRYRWVTPSDLPPEFRGKEGTLVHRQGSIREPDFGIKEGQTSGKYGKPAEYWDRFRRAIADKTAKPAQWNSGTGRVMNGWTIEENLYRIPNPDMADIVNTVQKMAQKRGLIAATLLATNASEFYTQDMEDLGMIDSPYAPEDINPRGVDAVSPVHSARPAQHRPAPAHERPVVIDQPPQNDIPEESDGDFIEAWNNAIASRGGREDEAATMLAGMLKQRRRQSIGEVNGEGRKQLLKLVNDGKLDQYLDSHKNPTAAAPATTGAAHTTGPANQVSSPQPKASTAQANSTPATPPNSTGRTEPINDPLETLYGLDESEFKISCRQIALGAKHMDRPAFEKAFGAYMMRIGKLGPKFKTMIPIEKATLYAAFRDGKIDASGNIQP